MKIPVIVGWLPDLSCFQTSTGTAGLPDNLPVIHHFYNPVGSGDQGIPLRPSPRSAELYSLIDLIIYPDIDSGILKKNP